MTYEDNFPDQKKQDLIRHLLKCADEYAEEAAEHERRAAHCRKHAEEIRDRVATL